MHRIASIFRKPLNLKPGRGLSCPSVWGLGAQGLGSLGFSGLGLGFRVQGLGFRVECWEFRIRVLGMPILGQVSLWTMPVLGWILQYLLGAVRMPRDLYVESLGSRRIYPESNFLQLEKGHRIPIAIWHTNISCFQYGGCGGVLLLACGSYYHSA